MRVINKRLDNLGEGYYLKHLDILDCILPIKLGNITKKVLASFLSLDIGKDRFSSVGRKIVRDGLNLSHSSLSFYIKDLEKKGYIYKNEYGIYEIRGFLFPEGDSQGYQIKIIK